jgi:hypothetical protein
MKKLLLAAVAALALAPLSVHAADDDMAYAAATVAGYEKCKSGTLTAAGLAMVKGVMLAVPTDVAKAAIDRVANEYSKLGEVKWCAVTAPQAEKMAAVFNAQAGRQ